MVSSRREPRRIELRLAVGADFADLFEIKIGSGTGPRRSPEPRGRRLGAGFAYRGDFTAQTRVEPLPPADRSRATTWSGTSTWRRREEWHARPHVPFAIGTGAVVPVTGDFADVSPAGRRRGAPLDLGRAALAATTRRWAASMPADPRDLAALRLDRRSRGNDHAPGGRAAWFLTLFGRDTLITAYQTLPFGPGAGRGALLALAALQGNEVDDFRTRSPARSCTRCGSGELTQLGTQAAQPVLRHRRRHPALADPAVASTGAGPATTSCVALCARTRSRALEWIDRYGDRDGDGYVEYADASRAGPGQPVLAGLVGRRASSPTARIPRLPIATLRDPGLRLRRQAADGRAGRRPARRPGAGRAGCAREADGAAASGSTATSGSTSGAATTRSALDGDKQRDRLA